MSDDLTLIAWSLTKERGSEIGQVRILVANQWIVLGNRSPDFAFFEYKITDYFAPEVARFNAVLLTEISENKGYTLDRDPQQFTVNHPYDVGLWLNDLGPRTMEAIFSAVRDYGFLLDGL